MVRLWERDLKPAVRVLSRQERLVRFGSLAEITPRPDAGIGDGRRNSFVRYESHNLHLWDTPGAEQQ
jgi:hypothetical protein